MSRQELEDLFDAAVADKVLFRAIVTTNPLLWSALRKIGRYRKRAKYGKWYPLARGLELAIMWPLRIITAPFKGYV